MSSFYKSLVIILFLCAIGLGYVNYRTNTYVTAEFSNLRPFHSFAPIYYNGFKIGRVVKVKPNKTYTSTIVTMEFHPYDLKLPVNISASLKKEKNRWGRKFDYIDIMYPKDPSIYYLKDGDRISGKTTVDVESFFANQEPETLEQIKLDMAESAKNLNITLQTIGDLFSTLNDMAVGVSPNMVKASKDFSETTGNFVKVSESATDIADNMTGLSNSVSGAMSSERMNTTAQNVQTVSDNIKQLSKEMNNAFPQVNCSLQQINGILYNLNEMTAGMNCTMKKPFGGVRMIFGSPVSKKKCDCR